MVNKDNAYWDDRINKAAQKAVALYDEVIKHRFALVLEATDSIQEQLKNMVTREEFNAHVADSQTMWHALKATNRNLRKLEKIVRHG